MRRPSLASLAAGTLLALSALTGNAQAADPIMRQPEMVKQLVPRCDDARVLAQVEDQFEYGAPNMLHASLTIEEFSDMRERGWLAERGDPRPIERRWCEARAMISDGHRRPVYYVIEFPMGYAAIGRYVGLVADTKLGFRTEGCVAGLDRWRVYGADCQSLRRVENGESRSYLPD